MANVFLKVNKDLFKLGLNPTQILILAQVIEFDTNTGDCFISNEQMASMFGVSVSTIKRELDKLEALGYITRETKNVKGGKERHIRLNLNLVEDNKAQNEPWTRLNLNLDKGQNEPIKDNIKDNSLKDNRGISCASATNPIGIWSGVDREALAAARTPAERMKALGF